MPHRPLNLLRTSCCNRLIPALAALFLATGRAAEPLDPAVELARSAETLILHGEQERALQRLRALVREYPKSPLAPAAQLRIGELFAQNREYLEAFNECQKLIVRFPESDLFTKAMEIQFSVADMVTEQYRKLKIKPGKNARGLPDRTASSDMFRTILANGRYTAFGPRAQYRLGVSLDEEGNPTEAIRELNALLRHFPDHPLAAHAAFQVAFIDYRTSRSTNFERGAQERAKLAFEDFLARYPQSEKVPEAKHLLLVLNDWEASRLVDAAKFYDRTGKPQSALRTFREAQQTGGEPAHAERVTERIRQLEDTVPSTPGGTRAAQP
jgi:outer membrane protein assembly factor BamD (BamD/ComL family)